MNKQQESQLATKKDLEKALKPIVEDIDVLKRDVSILKNNDRALREDLDNLAILTKQGFDNVDRRFASIDQKFGSIDHKFDSIDKRFNSIDQKFDIVDQRLTDSERNINGLRQEMRQGFTDLSSGNDKIINMFKKWELEHSATIICTRRHDDVLEDHEKRLVRVERKVGVGA